MLDLGYESKFVTPDHPRWPEWQEICNYTGWNQEGPLKPVIYHGFIKPFSKTLGVNQHFYNILMSLIRQKKAIRMAVVGPAGTGKTYAALHIAQIMQPSFSVDQIVFSGEDYLRLQNSLKDGQVMLMEEPTYMASARGWQSEWQQAVVRTIESSRFQNNPLLMPVVNRNLLDKVVREHYVNYVLEMFDRGIGRVYFYKQSQWRKEGRRNSVSDLAIYEPGVDLARCSRDTCLSCRELSTCNKHIWPRYERKRAAWVDYYQKRDREKLEAKNNKQTSGEVFIEMCDDAFSRVEDFKDAKGKISSALIIYNLRVGRNEAQNIKRVLEFKLKPE